MSCADSARKRFAKWRVDLAIHDALEVANRFRCGEKFERLLTVALSRSNMLRAKPVDGYAGHPHVELYLRGLLALARQRRHWLRECEDWFPSHDSPFMQFGALTRHVMANSPVPEFMTRVWFEGFSSQAERHQSLFKHLARGGSIRGANVPLRLTKPMARCFATAPHHVTVEQALRWAQVRSYGASKRFAAEVLKTPLATNFQQDTYWQAVLQLLVLHQDQLLGNVEPVVQYMNYRHRYFPPTITTRQLARSLNAFLQGTSRVAGQYRWSQYRASLRWKGLPIRGLRYVEKTESAWRVHRWSIRELLTRDELLDEGQAQSHCVASYERDCVARRSSIWSLRRHTFLEDQRVLTIEIEPKTRTIVTALGKCNSRPNKETRAIIQHWAEQEDLRIADWV